MLKLNRFFFDQAISIDNALTTNQIIHQIIKQVKEVVEYVNSLETDAHEYTDAKVLELKNQLEQQISDLETYLKGYTDTKLTEGKTYTDSEIANLRINYIDVKVSEIYATITSLESRLNAKIDLVDATLTNLIDDVRTELIELIKKGNSIIYSGYTGLLTALQDEIHNIYDVYSKFFGLTWDCFDKYISQYTYMYYVGSRNYNNAKIINNGTFNSFLCGGDIVSYSITEENDTHTLTVNLSTALNDVVSTIRFNNVDIPDTDFIISTDRKSFVVNNVDISLLDYSCNLLRLGYYTGSTYNVFTNFYLSNFDATNKINLTWYTIDRLVHYDGLDITYDFINYYFYTDFASVISKFILTDGESGALLNTLIGYSDINGTPNYLSSYNAFGLNDTVFLSTTEDKLSKPTKSRIF